MGEKEVPHYDYVLIDEAQDWPELERDTVCKLFGPQRCIVADGVDQLVRSNRQTEWTARLKGVPHQVVPLRQSLRLKASLATFAAMLDQKIGIDDWNLRATGETHGGRVTALIGSFYAVREALVDLVTRFSDGVNLSIDSLICAPYTSDTAGTTRTVLEVIAGSGHEYWDGTDRENRSTFSSDVSQVRVVTYDSCRGLEGWNVICTSFDRLLDQKEKRFDPGGGAKDLYVSDEQAARRHAASWAMIPVSRAIDHLVLYIEDDGHWITNAIRDVTRDVGPDCDWLEIIARSNN